MLTKKQIVELQTKYKVSASKRFGQNFLIDKNIVKKIIEESDIKNKDVIEIGPGLGSMTIPMLDVVNTLQSYEIDDEMIHVLQNEISNDKFTLIEGDFLKSEFNWSNKKVIVANIPYNITSDILFKIFKNSSKFESATLMMQKEVADRLVAPVGSKQYGKLTITTKLFADVKRICNVKPQSFIPAPKVESSVVKLIFQNNFDYNKNKDMIDFIKNCFLYRRKTLFNNLKKIMPGENALALIEKMGLAHSVRPQELSKDQFIKLFEYFVYK